MLLIINRRNKQYFFKQQIRFGIEGGGETIPFCAAGRFIYLKDIGLVSSGPIF